MKHLKYYLVAALLMLPLAFAIAQTKKTARPASSPVVEVLYFHGPQRCRTCVALQKAAKEVVTTKFAKELKSGHIKFREIDISSKAGEKLADKYEIAWSSLIIVRKAGKKETVADLTDDGFKYAVNNKAKIQSIIQQKITQFLK